MKILKSTSVKLAGNGEAEDHLLPYYVYFTGAGKSPSRTSRKLCYVLQIMSIFVICSTLLVYQVTTMSTGGTTNSVTGGGRYNMDIMLEDESTILISEDGLALDNYHSEINKALDDVSKALVENNVVSDSSLSSSVSAIPNKSSPNSSSSNSNRASEDLNNVFLSVKSTKRFHSSRLEPILQTWFNLARDQTWIFTDDDDPDLLERTNGHVINTHCPSTHYRQALCCKMATEFDTFIQTSKSWFCHFDDDNYVNVPALLDLLGKYNAREYWYLGKPSLKSPIKIRDPDNHTEEVSFWFATGGAGFCLSRALALRMSPLASGGKFIKVCDRIQLPDDVTVGYIAGHLLGQNLTVIPQFHSHFETMKFIDMKKNPSSEITFSYVRYAEYENILEIPDGFPEKEDPTRFLSLHCQLFPNFSYCSNGNLTRVNR